MVFVIFTELCNYRHNLILNIFIPAKRNPVPISCLPPIPSPNPQPQATTNLLSVFKECHILDISYQGDHIIYGLL